VPTQQRAVWMRASAGSGGGQRRPRVKQRVGPKIACVRCGAPVRRVSGRPFLSTEYCAYPQCQLQGEQLQQLLEQQQQRQEQQRRALAQLQQRQEQQLEQQQQRQEQQRRELTQLQQRHQRELSDWDRSAQGHEQQYQQARQQLLHQHQAQQRELNVARIGWPVMGGGGSSAPAHFLAVDRRKRQRQFVDRHGSEVEGQTRIEQLEEGSAAASAAASGAAAVAAASAPAAAASPAPPPPPSLPPPLPPDVPSLRA
jgi:flagellar biosynthesis GTPase FlhF